MPCLAASLWFLAQAALASLPGEISDGCPTGKVLMEDGSCATAIYRKKQHLDFTDQEVDGELQTPYLDDITSRKSATGWKCPAGELNQRQLERCYGVPVPCPPGTVRVKGECRDPGQDLEDIPDHTYKESTTVTREIKKPTEDKNKPINEEGQKLGEKFRDEFDRTQECPKDLGDIAALKKLTAQAKATGLPSADVSLLIAQPKDPFSSVFDPGLPRSCGYHARYDEWFSINFYCEDQDACFSQSGSRYSRNCTLIMRSKSPDNLWIPRGRNCDGSISYRNDPEHASHLDTTLNDLVLIPLGNGLFIEAYQREGAETYHGLIIVPTARMQEFEKTVVRKSLTPKELRKSDSQAVSAWEKYWRSQSGKQADERALGDEDLKRLERMIGKAKEHLDGRGLDGLFDKTRR